MNSRVRMMNEMNTREIKHELYIHPHFDAFKQKRKSWVQMKEISTELASHTQ